MLTVQFSLFRIGNCLLCKGNTMGDRCENCKVGFYRPVGVLTEECVKCPCSLLMSTGTCHLGSAEVVCDQCSVGYMGPKCNQCDKGYYDHDTICVKCNCSGNVDPVDTPEICNPATGICSRCVNNTQGNRCERCLDGYTGDPMGGNCIKTGKAWQSDVCGSVDVSHILFHSMTLPTWENK
ncbi:hypothetical protein FKM82_021762 [Ascaphus truei]